jgi:hypothetical protein
MISVKIKNISITDIGFVIFLKSDDNEKVLPIFIGPVEAQAISMILLKTASKRPLTHDLLFNTLNQIGYTVGKVEITDIKSETFYSTLYLKPKEGESEQWIAVDSRPSDAIALALRSEAPIFVREELMSAHSIMIEQSEIMNDEEQAVEAGNAISKKINEQLGTYQKMLDEAVKEDRFEDAARLRNQIEELMGKQN